MDWLTLSAGIAILLLALFDIVWSTLSTNGAGWMTGIINRATWAALLALSRKLGTRRLLTSAGPLYLLLNVAVWVGLVWVGWTLVFHAHPLAVVDSTTQIPAETVARLYYVGYSMFTLGTGDYVSGTNGWRLVQSICSGVGFFVATLAITYLLSVVSAVIEKRRLAGLISVTGISPAEFIEAGWDGSTLDGLSDRLNQIPPELLLHSERHLAYPVIHYFTAEEPEASLSRMLLTLHDAVVILATRVRQEHRPTPTSMVSTLRSIDMSLSRMRGDYIEKEAEAPPTPDVERLDGLGILRADGPTNRECLGRAEDRRRLLAGLLRSDGWDVENLEGEPSKLATRWIPETLTSTPR